MTCLIFLKKKMKNVNLKKKKKSKQMLLTSLRKKKEDKKNVNCLKKIKCYLIIELGI